MVAPAGLAPVCLISRRENEHLLMVRRMSGKTCKAVSGKAGELCGLVRDYRNLIRAKGDSRNTTRSLDVIRAGKRGGHVSITSVAVWQ